MAKEFRLPDLGENIESGDVISLLVQEGDVIAPNQPVLEVETGKATVELPCPFGGRVERIHVRPGQTVPVGALLLTLGEAEAGAKGTGPAPTGSPSVQASAPGSSPASGQAPAGAAAPPTIPSGEIPLEAAPPSAGLPHAASPPPVTAQASMGPGPLQTTASIAEWAGGMPGSVPAGTHTSLPQVALAQAPAAATAVPSVGTPSAAISHAGAPSAGRLAEGAARPGARETPTAAAASALPSAAILGLDTAPAGPATRRLARELGIDLRLVRGTGPGGRITEDDVKQAVRQAAAAATAAAPLAAEPPTGHDAWGPIRVQPLSAIRRTIAQNMVRSVAAVPQVTNFDDADVTELERIRKGSLADYVQSEVKLTLLPFVIKAAAHALRQHPALNASLEMETSQVIYKQYINIGVAVDTERGLVVPVLRHVDRLSIPQIAVALAELASKARSNAFTPEDLRGGTFTISNLGAVGGSYSTPIINPPEVAILLTGRAREMPVVVEGQIAVRLMLPLSLTYDHRLIDGAAAARFLNAVKSYLQLPGRLLLAP
jgi:pyruvate dehydrogenase E2 component (dihydrolipoamide acetyltransferase)